MSPGHLTNTAPQLGTPPVPAAARLLTVVGRAAALVVLAAMPLAAGCGSPLYADPDKELRRSLVTAAQRELREAQAGYQVLVTQREDKVAALGIRADILAQLEAASGPGSYIGQPIRLSASLMGAEQKTVAVNLQRCILTAVDNNLAVQFARLAPAVEEARTQAAEAAFDWAFFANSQYSNLDREAPAQFSRSLDQRQEVTGTFGLRRRLTSGAQFAVQQTIGYADSKVTTGRIIPDPAGTAELAMQLDQPLLRNFGADANLAEVRIASNAERDQVQQLKTRLLATVTDTEEAYWNLVAAWGQLQIAQRLAERGVRVREVIRTRVQVAGDANQSQLADTVAQVASREADVVRAENAVRNASDRLKSLINDRDLPVGSDALLIPADLPVDQPVAYSLADALFTAIASRPEVQRGLIGVDDAAIRQQVADNQRLPQLDLRAQVRFAGLDNGNDRAFNRMINGGFVDYVVGLVFEQPIGNRAGEAGFRQRRLERAQAAIAYRDVVQRVVADVVGTLRAVVTSYTLIEQTRAARLAAAENLRALEVLETTIQGLTPEFLDLKLRRQAALASSELQELQALTEYNTSIARLHAAMGTALQRNRIKFQVPASLPNSAITPQDAQPLLERPLVDATLDPASRPAPAQPAGLAPIEPSPGAAAAPEPTAEPSAPPTADPPR